MMTLKSPARPQIGPADSEILLATASKRPAHESSRSLGQPLVLLWLSHYRRWHHPAVSVFYPPPTSRKSRSPSARETLRQQPHPKDLLVEHKRCRLKPPGAGFPGTGAQRVDEEPVREDNAVDECEWYVENNIWNRGSMFWFDCASYDT